MHADITHGNNLTHTK